MNMTVPTMNLQTECFREQLALPLSERTNSVCDDIIPADALESVDCWEPSSKGVPSGPVVTTDVTVPGVAAVTFVVVPAT